MSGALAERVFVHKLKRVGFTNIQVEERHPFGLEQAALYPLFGPDLIQLMQDLIPEDRQGQVAVSVTVTADNP